MTLAVNHIEALRNEAQVQKELGDLYRENGMHQIADIKYATAAWMRSEVVRLLTVARQHAETVRIARPE